MDYTFEDLSSKTVAQLREIAKPIEHDAMRGYSTMRKEQLLGALCEALGVEAREHHAVVGFDKGRVKAEIRELKSKRDEALESRDRKELKRIRRKLHRLKRKIRKATL